MNELLQKHGCSNVFSIPEGLKELMSDITREVLREQPANLFEFISNYLSVLLITREHGVLALRILDDLCDCKPSVSEHLMQLGMEREQAESLAEVIQEEIEGFEPIEGKEKVKELQIMKKILTRSVLDEETSAKVCQVARNAYRDYWYRKKLLEQSMKMQPDEPWEIAAQHTLELYKKTKPSFSELTRATQKIQAAYRGYHVRKNLLSHLKPKRKKQGPKVDLLGPPIDSAASREIDLGPMIDIKVREDNVNVMFDDYAGEQLGLQYDPMKTITHVDDEDDLYEQAESQASEAIIETGGVQSTKSLAAGLPSSKSIAEGLTSSKSMGVVEAKSKISRMDDIQEPRQSRVASALPDSARQSRNPSAIGRTEQSLLKISFAEQPPIVIPDFPEPGEDEDLDMNEIMEPHDIQEVQEEPGVEPAQAVEGEPAQEIPEDVPDDHTEGEEESAPMTSIPSSGPATANSTDFEYDPGETTGEDEGNEE